MNIGELRKEMKFIADAFHLIITQFDISKDDEIVVRFKRHHKERFDGDKE